jgi:hypothetical protein
MKRLLMAALATCAAAVALVAVPTPASAAAVHFQCAGTAELRFAPGLTNTPQTVQVLYSSDVFCPISPFGTSQGTGFGTYTITGASCTNVALVTNTETYNWSPRGGTSDVDYSAVSLNLSVVSQLVQEGTVVSGTAAGDQALETITLTNLNLAACGTATGLVTVSGPETLGFYSL